MKVRLPRDTDLWDWLDLLNLLFEEGIDSGRYGVETDDAERTFFLWRRNPQTISFVMEHGDKLIGFITGITSPHLFNLANWYYYEHVWYMHPDYRHTGWGIKLYEATEEECIKRGISHMLMVNQVNFKDKLFKRIYPKLGYKQLERVWVKDI